MLFLFGAQEQVIHLVGERVFFIPLEQRLKRAFVMLFKRGCKISSFRQRVDERRFANAARADD